MTGSSYLWEVISGEIPVMNKDLTYQLCDIMVEGNVITMAYGGLGGLLWKMTDRLADRWVEVKQIDVKELAGMEEDEMREEACFFKLWVGSEYPLAYDMINEDDIEDLYYEGILTIGIRNRLEDGRPFPASELSEVMQDECEIDLYEVLENEGGDSAATVFEEWVAEKHPQIYSRMLEYQTTQEKNIFEYSG